MRKIVLILLSIVILGSCSVLKKSDTSLATESTLNRDVLGTVRAGNITNSGFFIEKAEIRVSDRNGTKKMLASVKYLKPQNYLISLRGSGGIEAARIFITMDSALINDRINKILYVGTRKAVERKYGVNFDILPVLLGDVIGTDKIMKSNPGCEGGMINVTDNIKGVKVNYRIDCKKYKSVFTSVEQSAGIKEWELVFRDFIGKDNNVFPGRIIVSDINTDSVIEVRIIRLAKPWDGEIKFIPGNRYEKVMIK